MECTQTLNFDATFGDLKVNWSHFQVLSHLLVAAATCLASLESQNDLVSLESQNEDSALATRGGKSLLATFPFNAQTVDDLNLHESRHLVENVAPALPASQALDARDARQVEITILTTL